MPSEPLDDLATTQKAMLTMASCMLTLAGALGAVRTTIEARELLFASRATPAPLRDVKDIIAEVASWPTAEETGAPLMEPGPCDDFILAARRIRDRERRGAIKLVVNNNEGQAS